MTYLCRTPRQHDTPVSCVAGGAQRHGQLSQYDLALMRRIDQLHLEHPFAGTQKWFRWLTR